MTDHNENTAWLIERHDLEGGSHYFAERRGNHWWTRDPNEAEQFPDERTARRRCNLGDVDGPLLVYEHKWIDPVEAIAAAGGE